MWKVTARIGDQQMRADFKSKESAESCMDMLENDTDAVDIRVDIFLDESGAFNTGLNCNNKHRTMISVQKCKCMTCKHWWCDHVNGYFICLKCHDVCLVSVGRYDGTCEECYDDAAEEDDE